MQSSTVLIIAGSGFGSGFVVGNGGYVVTNWHVVSKASEILVIVDKTRHEATVKIKSEQKDLAVLELQRKIDRPDVTFAPASLVKSAQQVYAMGFPGAAMGDNVDIASSISEVKISDGIIGARNVKSKTGTLLYQTSAAINPGNSGGPLFNFCGQVVGINVMKSLTEVITTEGKAVRVPEGEGIGWAVKVDELFPLLEQAAISYYRVRNSCLSGASGAVAAKRDPLVIAGMGIALVLALVAVFMASTGKGRKVMQSTFSSRSVDKSRSVVAPQKKPEPEVKREIRMKPILRGITGQYQGVDIPLTDESISIGRDPKMSQLVLAEGKDCDEVSGRHCTLTYEAEKRRFRLEDNWSTNGTFLESGEEVSGRQPVYLRKGDRFYLSSKHILFEVTEEE